MSLVDIDDATWQYQTQPDDEWALESVSLHVEREEFVGITGPSDAGKSTLCRLIPGYIPHFFDGPMFGSVTVDGIDVSETTIGDMATTAGLLFENPFDQLTGASTTVIEEVAFGMENLGLPREEIIDRAIESLEMVNILDLIDRRPQQLSGGQSQRLSLASILAMRPEILVLDEPTSQLDPQGTKEVLEVVSRMDEEGFTVIMVSQDLAQMAQHLDRLVVLDDGRLVDQGPPHEVLAREETTEGRVAVPDTVTIGRYLRDAGHVGRTQPLPLTVEAAVDELSPVIVPRAAPNPSTAAGTPPAGPPRTGDEHHDGEHLIKFEDVRFLYNDEIEALRDISITLDAGCICIIGENGAGKSTFAKHLNGLLKPSEGTVHVLGKDTKEYRVAQLARDVGLSFQNPDDQLFHDTVEAEIRYGPRNLGYDPDRIDALVESAVERMDLGDVRDRHPYDLGQARRKRVAVASVLAMDNPVIVLDEPTGGQDAPGTELLGEAVDTLVDEGRLVIVITHDMNFAREYATRVVVLGNGQVLLDGSPREVFNQPEVLAETNVDPPLVTQIGQRLNLPITVLDPDDLLGHVE